MLAPDRRFENLPRSPLKTLIAFYRGEYLRLSASLLVFVVKHAPSWGMPLVTANVVDIVADRESHDIRELWVNAAVLVVLQLQNVPTHYVYVKLISASIRRVEKDVRAALCRQMQHLSIGYYASTSAGALQTKAMRDAEVLEQLARQVFQDVPAIVLTIISVVVVIALRSPWLLLWLVAVVPVAALLVARARRHMEDRNQEFRGAIEQLSSSVSDMIRMIPVARAHSVERASLARVDDELDRVRRSGLRLDAVNGLFGGAAWVTLQCFNSLCLVFAGWAAYNHRMGITVGDVVLITGYFSTLSMAVQQLMTQLPLVGKGLQSVTSIREVLESPDVERNEGKARVTDVRGALTLERVSFAYDADGAGVHDLDLTIAAGQTVAFVGASGAGKTTLLNLMLGFLRPTSGRLLLDGRDMAGLDLRTYRRFVATVPQDTLLFAGSLRDNVLYGAEDVSEERLREALDGSHVSEFVRSLPHGLDTRLGEHGARLSGGQRQRISIARALVRDPRVLLLDEATSALDTHSERLVRDALATLMAGRTSLIVTHRLSTVTDADRIVVLSQGRIVESGTHDELLARQGTYAGLAMTMGAH